MLCYPAKATALVVLGFLLLACERTRQPFPLRPFESAFTQLDEVKLPGIKPASAGGFAIDSTGAIYVIDNEYKHIKKFDQAGRLIQTVGSPGRGPGLFDLPYSVACDVKDNLYVLDVGQSRVSIFDGAGALQRSFIFSAAGFTGISMTVSPSGDIYLGGWKSPLENSSTMVHKFDQQGNHLLSLLPVDEQVVRLHLSVVAGVEFATDFDDNLYAIQPVNPRLSKFTRTGEFAGELGRRPPFYQAPLEFPKLQYPRDESKITPLLSEWTQAHEIFVLPRKSLLMVFRTHVPKEYAIEIYDKDGNVLEGGIGSDLRPVMQDRQNRFYFIGSPSERDDQDQVTLLRYAINIEKGATNEP